MGSKESQSSDKLSAPAENPGSQLPHLERLVTGSRITIHSFTSPYLQKYSFKPSEKRNRVGRRHVNQEVRTKFLTQLSKKVGCSDFFHQQFLTTK